MGLGLIYRIAGLGIVVTAVTMWLEQTGRGETSKLVTAASVIIGLSWVIDALVGLMDALQVFGRYY